MTPSLFHPLTLPCGTVLKNRILKSAMSDSMGDGSGHPTAGQTNLYGIWADGGLAASIIGEVQGDPFVAEKPGNLVLREGSDHTLFKSLAESGARNGGQLWVQLGHAGAMAFPPISLPKGPSALNLTGVSCDELSAEEIAALPAQFAETARKAQAVGFGGVQIHAAHGFLLSQFLSPLFNQRTDQYGGSIENRMRLVLQVVDAVRSSVGPAFPIAIKLNATDQLEGGLVAEDALKVVAALDGTSIDLIDISGGTYFPGAKSVSDSAGAGPYFVSFAKEARRFTSKPLMVTGGFKTREQAEHAIVSGAADAVGLARALVLIPDLPNRWKNDELLEPRFPKFSNPPEGGITAWYTMRLTDIGEGQDLSFPRSLQEAIAAYEERDARRTEIWRAEFPLPT